MRLGIVSALAFGLLTAGAAAHAQWQTIEPGGDTLCADGSPFRFYVYPGDPARLVVEFEGGGACWDAVTCASGLYSTHIQADPTSAAQQGLLQGIYDRANPANPIREWTHVYVPYCTGDLHWGQVDQTYQGATGPYVVHHRGAVNARSAVAWTFEHVAAPSQLLVAGCSAGGYGSIMWAPHLLNHYPGARTAQLADSAAGVVPPEFLGVLRRSWGVDAVWPGFISALPPDRTDIGMVDFYSGVAGYYPLASFSQFNRTEDNTQILFAFLAGGTSPAQWSASMQSQVAAIGAANANFHSYTAPGADHCIINQASFYTTQVAGVRFSDWVTNLLATGNPGERPLMEPDDDVRRALLGKARRIAVVGLSPDPSRPSNNIGQYLVDQGYEVFPVYPKGDEILGRPVHRRVQDIAGGVDIVDVFRPGEEVDAVADDALAAGAKVLWLQIGVTNDEAVARARARGLTVITDHCIMAEHGRLVAGS